MTEGEIRHWGRRSDVATEGKIQQALQAAYQAHGVPIQPEKSHGPALQLDNLGTLLDGAFGAASTRRQFDVELLVAVCLDSWAPHSDSEAPADLCRKVVTEAPVQTRSQLRVV